MSQICENCNCNCLDDEGESTKDGVWLCDACQLDLLEELHGKPGIKLIAQERQRQIEVEGFTEQGDEEYDFNQLKDAAVAYLLAIKEPLFACDEYWPWDKEYFKPKDYKSNLVRAGALIAAELDRIERLENKK